MIYKVFSHNIKSANLKALLIYLFFTFPHFYPFSFTLLTIHSLGHKKRYILYLNKVDLYNSAFVAVAVMITKYHRIKKTLFLAIF